MPNKWNTRKQEIKSQVEQSFLINKNLNNIKSVSESCYYDLLNSGTPDHYFLELNNDITGQQWHWNNIAGDQTSKTKFNLSSGDYSWRIRGACGSNCTSWATILTQREYYI